jgi:hypothetical protein
MLFGRDERPHVFTREERAIPKTEEIKSPVKTPLVRRQQLHTPIQLPPTVGQVQATPEEIPQIEKELPGIEESSID